jgi:hypothetical protein
MVVGGGRVAFCPSWRKGPEFPISPYAVKPLFNGLSIPRGVVEWGVEIKLTLNNVNFLVGEDFSSLLSYLSFGT